MRTMTNVSLRNSFILGSVLAAVVAPGCSGTPGETAGPEALSEAREPVSSGVQMFIAAHQDDDLLFQSPDLYQAVSSGQHTVTIFVTAGNVDDTNCHDSDCGTGGALNALCDAATDVSSCKKQYYIQFRMAGSIAAYYAMSPPGAVQPDPCDWSSDPANKKKCADDLFARASCHIESSDTVRWWRCSPAPTVDLIYLGLSAGQGVNGSYPENVGGYNLGAGKTVEDLWKGNAPSGLDVTDQRLASASYSREKLIDVLASRMSALGPTRIGTLDSTKTVYDVFSINEPPATGWHLDHADHIYSSLFALEAEQRYSASSGAAHDLRIYRTYNLESLAYTSVPRFNLPNVPCPLAQAKVRAFSAYGPWDWGLQWAGASSDCAALYASEEAYPQWQARQAYTTKLTSFGASRIQGSGGCLSQLSSGTVGVQGCNGANRWRLDGHGQLHLDGTSLCLDGGSTTLLATCAAVPPTSQSWSVLDNGQIRGSNGTCLTVSGTSVSAADCAELSSQSSYGGSSPQRWTVTAGPASQSGIFPDSQGWALSETRYKSIRLGDVDGDGWNDLCGRSAGGIWCALNNHAGGFAAATLWGNGLFSDATGWGASQYGTTIMLGDIDGDGRADVCGRGIAGILCARSTGSSFTAMAVRSNDFSDAQGWGAGAAAYGSIRLGDVDGDGWNDICGRNAGGIKCALNNHAGGFATATLWGNGLFSDATGWGALQYGTTIQLGDVNGDGRADICGRGMDGILCALSTGSSFNNLSIWTRDFSNAQGWGASEVYYGSIRLADVNGDGLSDVCGRGPAGISCSLSQGMIFHRTWGELTSLDFGDNQGWATSKYGTTMQLGDINHDGRADICGRGIAGVLCAVMPVAAP